MSKQQTAVEWYRNTFFKALQEGLITSESEIFEKAKAMEREQIENAYDCGLFDGGDDVSPKYDIDSQQYFNETYGGDK